MPNFRTTWTFSELMKHFLHIVNKYSCAVILNSRESNIGNSEEYTKETKMENDEDYEEQCFRKE